MLLSPSDGPPMLHQVHILPPSESTSVLPPVPLILQNPPLDPNGLPPSFASAVQDPQMLETLPELLDRLDLDSVDSLRKYTKRILHEMVETCKIGIQGQSREQVQLHLGLLDDQWRDDKLSEIAKIKLGCLASALKNGDLKCGDKLHLDLMVNHITEVSQWMVSVKRIMSELKLLQSSSSQISTHKKLFKHSASSESAFSIQKYASVNGQLLDTNRFSDQKSNCLPEEVTPQHNSNNNNQQTMDKEASLQLFDKSLSESQGTKDINFR